jgi:hypothetical protein
MKFNNSRTAMDSRGEPDSPRHSQGSAAKFADMNDDRHSVLSQSMAQSFTSGRRS